MRTKKITLNFLGHPNLHIYIYISYGRIHVCEVSLPVWYNLNNILPELQCFVRCDICSIFWFHMRQYDISGGPDVTFYRQNVLVFREPRKSRCYAT